MVQIIVLATSLLSAAAAGEATSVKLDGETYGAEADGLGPIGGGDGYTKIVAKGDFVATNLDELLEALGKAKAGQVVFVPRDTEIDCTARVYIEQLVIEIPSGVTLAGNRGQDGSQGALIFSDALNTLVTDTPEAVTTTTPEPATTTTTSAN